MLQPGCVEERVKPSCQSVLNVTSSQGSSRFVKSFEIEMR